MSSPKFGKTGRYRVSQPVPRALFELEEERRYINPVWVQHGGGDQYYTGWTVVGRFSDLLGAKITASELAEESASWPKVVASFPKE